jgi:hypothetical protein
LFRLARAYSLLGSEFDSPFALRMSIAVSVARQERRSTAKMAAISIFYGVVI